MNWSKLSLAEQLGNIGSELHRARVWQEKGDIVASKNSLERAIELVDLTLVAQFEKRSVLKEVARLREVICDLFVGSNYYQSSLQNVIAFCLDFGLLTRK